MKIEASTVKGFQDYLPPESQKREAIKKIVEKYFRLYGFLPVETPVIEFDELMKSDTLPNEEEDEAISDRFRLKDRAGRNLGLRYEFTFQLARIFKQNPTIKLPFKRYQIGPVFRDEPIRTGRTRQFVQCDADIIGDKSVDADAELISMFSDIFKELKIKDYEIEVNNRKLLNSIIESVQIGNPKVVMRELDKISKIGEDAVKTNLRKYTTPNQIVTLFKLLEKDLKFFKENAFDGAEELEDFQDKCNDYGIKIKFNPFMIRGFGYYTGNIFEFITKNKTACAGGGRFDNTVGKYSGREIPAVGISFSLEAIMGLFPEEISKLDIDSTKAVLISISQDKETIKLSKKLRKSNVSCITQFVKPGKALEYANAMNIPYAIFIGEEEVDKKKFKLKNMESGKEELLTEKQIIKKLS